MLQDLRKYTQGTTAKVLVGLIVISFAFFGIESILVDGGGNEIAQVNGDSIYPQELQQAVETQKRRLMGMMGESLDPALLDDERLKPQAMSSLINRKLMMQSAELLNLTISERAIGQVVASMEQFQVDGAFSPDAYKSVLSNAGYTPAYFKEMLRDDIVLSQLQSGLAGSEFSTPAELALSTAIILEQRDFRYFTMPIEKFAPTSPATDAEIEAFYSANQENFRAPESLDIEYLELALDDFRQPVKQSAIQEAYELSKQDAQFKAQHRVSHILFESADADEVKQKLGQAQEKLNAGVAFAEVAKEFSQDVGTADKGGDLGYSSGDAFPEEMELAIAKLEPGVVSGPVETDVGTHLILVTERTAAKEPSLEEMHEQLHESIQSDQARIDLLRTVESLKDLVFNAEDLAFPAKELNLVVKKKDGVTRTQADGLFSNSALLDAAFSEEVMSSGSNSEVIELEGDKFVVLHVRKHNAAEVRPLESVRDEVVKAVAREAASVAIAAEAGGVLEQVQAGLQIEQFADSHGYELRTELGVDRRNRSIPPDVMRRIFELAPPATDKPETDFVIAQNGDALVMQLLRVNAGDYKSLEDAEKEQLQNMLGGEYSGLVNHEFQRGLHDGADISVL